MLVNDILNDIEYLRTLTKWDIQFNDTDLSSLDGRWYWIMVKHWNELSLDNIDITEFESELSDWWYVLNKKYWNKKIAFTLFVQWSSYNDLLIRLSELKAGLEWVNGDLCIKRGDTIYKYEATCTKITINDFDLYQDWADDVKVEFVLTSPFGETLDAEIINFTKENINQFEKIVTNIWNYKAYPTIIIVWKPWCDCSAQEIEIKKVWDVSGQTVTTSLTLQNQDVLLLDYKNKQITLNNVIQPFDGFMTALEVWKNVINFNLTWDINVEITILYNKVLI